MLIISPAFFKAIVDNHDDYIVTSYHT